MRYTISKLKITWGLTGKGEKITQNTSGAGSEIRISPEFTIKTEYVLQDTVDHITNVGDYKNRYYNIVTALSELITLLNTEDTTRIEAKLQHHGQYLVPGADREILLSSGEYIPLYEINQVHDTVTG